MIDINDSYGFVLIKIARKLENSYDEILKTYSLTLKHFRVLLAIYNNNNISQKEVSELLKVDRTTVVHLVDKLEEKNYIKRETNQEDRRSFQLTLTNKGNFIMEPLWKIRSEIEMQVVNDLSRNQKKILKEICRNIGED